MSYWECYTSEVRSITKGFKWWMLVPINWICLVLLIIAICPVDAYYAYRAQFKKFIDQL